MPKEITNHQEILIRLSDEEYSRLIEDTIKNFQELIGPSIVIDISSVVRTALYGFNPQSDGTTRFNDSFSPFLQDLRRGIEKSSQEEK